MRTLEERKTENKPFFRNMYGENIHNQRNEEIYVKLKINEGISPKYESSYKQATRQTKT